MEVSVGIKLHTHTFDIPVPEFPSRPVSIDGTAVSTPTEPTPNEFSSGADIFHGSQLSICWNILGDSKCLEITPLELDSRRLQGEGARIRLTSHFPIISHCVAISEINGSFVIDFITTLGALNTILIPVTWLLHPQDKYPAQPETRVSRPFSFDLVTPRIIKAVNHNLLVLSLVDGTFMRLDRDSPLGAVTYLNLRESQPSVSAGGFARFFRSTKDKVPGHPYLSMDSAVSVAIINDHLVATYSVNNTIRLWSLLSNTCIQFIGFGDSLPLRMRPSNFITANGHIVIIALTNEIRVYELNEQEEKLQELSSKATKIDDNLHSWFLTCLHYLDSGSILVAFKLDMNARIYLIDENGWNLVGGYDNSKTLDILTNASIPAIKNRIRNLPTSIVSLALSQFAPEVNIELETQDVIELITSILLQKNTTANLKDLHTEWLRLDTICREFEVQAEELLAIAPALSTNAGLFFWTLRVAGITLMSVKTNHEDGSKGARHEVLDIAETLLGSVPEDVFSVISTNLLSQSLVMDKIDNICALLLPYLDQLKLNEIGRTSSGNFSTSILEYFRNYGADADESDNAVCQSSSVKLSNLGSSALTSLVYDYCAEHALKYRLLASLSVVALVEGWLAKDDNADVLRITVNCMRKFTIMSHLKSKKVNLNITEAPLEYFGIELARSIISKVDVISLMAQLLPPFKQSLSPQDYKDFNIIVGYCENNAELTVLKSFAALAIGDEMLGVSLAQQVSLSRPWPRIYGERPNTQSSWFLEVAMYAESVGAKEAAFSLTQYGESLSSSNDARATELLEYLFRLAIESGNIYVAYSAFTRRFSNLTESESDESEAWIKEMITAAARRSPDEALNLIVNYPFIGFATAMQKTLNSEISFATVPSYKLRYTWHVEHDDFVGAAQVIYKYIKSEPRIDTVRRAELYTVCLNALSIANPESRWLTCGEQTVSYNAIKEEHKALLDEMAAHI